MIKFSFLLTLLFSSGLSFAQDTDLDLGINAYSEGDDPKALSLLNKVLSNPSSMAPEAVAEAYYYRARVKLSIYQDAVATSSQEEVKNKEPFFYEAYQDYRKSEEKDQTGKWKPKVRQDLRVMFSNALQGSMSKMNKSYSAQNASRKSQLVSEAEKMIKLSLAIDESYYVPHDVYGQILYEKGQIAEAIDQFDHAQEKYYVSGQIDFHTGYTYYRSALGYKSLNQLQSALDEIMSGVEFLDEEFTKHNSSGRITKEQQQQYRRVKSDLKNLELDIYLNYPDKLSEAIVRFKEDVKNDPKNYSKAVAYASLLEKVDPFEAIDAYQSAINIDPAKETAYFNLGVLYNNLAADLSDQASKHLDLRKANELQNEAKNHMGNALTYFEQALKVNETLRTVVALKKITKFLNLEDKHQFYESREVQLLKN